MSLEAMAVVLHHSKSNGTAKLVLLGIANHAGDGGAWPAVSTLARYAGVHERNVQHAVRKLVQLGELAVHQQRGGTLDSHRHDYLRPNRYEVLLSCPAWCDRTYQHRTLPAWRDAGDGTYTTEPQPETLPGLEPEPVEPAPDVEPVEPDQPEPVVPVGSWLLPVDGEVHGKAQPVDVELPDALPGPCVACGRPAHPIGSPTCCTLCAHEARVLVEPHDHAYSAGRCTFPGCSSRQRRATPAPVEVLEQLRASLSQPVDKPGGDSATG